MSASVLQAEAVSKPEETVSILGHSADGNFHTSFNLLLQYLSILEENTIYQTLRKQPVLIHSIYTTEIASIDCETSQRYLQSNQGLTVGLDDIEHTVDLVPGKEYVCLQDSTDEIDNIRLLCLHQARDEYLTYDQLRLQLLRKYCGILLDSTVELLFHVKTAGKYDTSSMVKYECLEDITYEDLLLLLPFTGENEVQYSCVLFLVCYQPHLSEYKGVLVQALQDVQCNQTESQLDALKTLYAYTCVSKQLTRQETVTRPSSVHIPYEVLTSHNGIQTLHDISAQAQPGKPTVLDLHGDGYGSKLHNIATVMPYPGVYAALVEMRVNQVLMRDYIEEWEQSYLNRQNIQSRGPMNQTMSVTHRYAHMYTDDVLTVTSQQHILRLTQRYKHSVKFLQQRFQKDLSVYKSKLEVKVESTNNRYSTLYNETEKQQLHQHYGRKYLESVGSMYTRSAFVRAGEHGQDVYIIHPSFVGFTAQSVEIAKQQEERRHKLEEERDAQNVTRSPLAVFKTPTEISADIHKQLCAMETTVQKATPLDLLLLIQVYNEKYLPSIKINKDRF